MPRKQTAAYGLSEDEFTDTGGWPWMIYIREARRMVGDYVMTQHDCEGKKSAPDPVALGSFGMDSHVVQHFVTEILRPEAYKESGSPSDFPPPKNP